MSSTRSSSLAKKTDVAEYRKAFNHVGLLFNEPPGTNWVALYLVFRRLRGNAYSIFGTSSNLARFYGSKTRKASVSGGSSFPGLATCLLRIFAQVACLTDAWYYVWQIRPRIIA